MKFDHRIWAFRLFGMFIARAMSDNIPVGVSLSAGADRNLQLYEPLPHSNILARVSEFEPLDLLGSDSDSDEQPKVLIERKVTPSGAAFEWLQRLECSVA